MNEITNIVLDEERILEEYKDSFERLFIELSKDVSQDEQIQSINTLSKILAISKENLDKISSENWFQRIWYQVTGENKKLSKINQKNLIEVQKISAVFLKNYAKDNHILQVAINEALNRIDENDETNAKIKLYLIEWTKKNNIRNISIERRLEKLERGRKDKRNSFWYKLSSFIKKLFLGKKYNEVYISGDAEVIDNSIYENNKLVYKEVKDNIEKWFLLGIEISANKSVNFIFENAKTYDNFVDTLNNGNNYNEEYITNLIKDTIYYSPISDKILDDYIISAINMGFDTINEVTSYIANKYIPESACKLIVDIPYSEKTKLANNCIRQVALFKKEISIFEEKQKKLIALFPKFSSVYNRSVGQEFLRGFAEGCIPLWGQIRGFIDEPFFGGKIKEKTAEFFGIKTSQAYINEFIDALNELFAQYYTLCEKSTELVYEVVKTECQAFLKSWINKYDILLDEFSNYNIDLNYLNNEVIESIRDLENS